MPINMKPKGVIIGILAAALIFLIVPQCVAADNTWHEAETWDSSIEANPLPESHVGEHYKDPMFLAVSLFFLGLLTILVFINPYWGFLSGIAWILISAEIFAPWRELYYLLGLTIGLIFMFIGVLEAFGVRTKRFLR